MIRFSKVVADSCATCKVVMKRKECLHRNVLFITENLK